MQPIKPRIRRNGLMGRCSATSGLGIKALLLTQSCHASASFHSGERTRLACWRWRPRHRELFERHVVRTPALCREARALPRGLLTSCLCTRKLEDEYEKHDLVSTYQSWHVRVDGSNASATRSR